jgi:hypothetical protein
MQPPEVGDVLPIFDFRFVELNRRHVSRVPRQRGHAIGLIFIRRRRPKNRQSKIYCEAALDNLQSK